MANEHAIGYENKLPWNTIKGDMQFFKLATTNTKIGTLTIFTETKDEKDKKDEKNIKKRNAVIMGFNTFLSMQCLKNRLNVIISRNIIETDISTDVVYVQSFEKALDFLKKQHDIEQVFVIGGAMIFQEALNHPLCTKVYLTYIYHNYKHAILDAPDLYVRHILKHKIFENKIFFFIF